MIDLIDDFVSRGFGTAKKMSDEQYLIHNLRRNIEKYEKYSKKIFYDYELTQQIGEVL